MRGEEFIFWARETQQSATTPRRMPPLARSGVCPLRKAVDASSLCSSLIAGGGMQKPCRVRGLFCPLRQWFWVQRQIDGAFIHKHHTVQGCNAENAGNMY